MARSRITLLKSFYTSINPAWKMRTLSSYSSPNEFMKAADQILSRPLFIDVSHKYHKYEWHCPGNLLNTRLRMLALQSPVDRKHRGTDPITTYSPVLSTLNRHCTLFPIRVNTMSSYRMYSSYFSSKRDDSHRDTEIPATSGTGEMDVDNTSIDGNDWVERFKNACKSAEDALVYTEQKAKEAFDELTPHIQQLLDSHPYLRNVIIPVGGTLTATMLAWLVMPRILRRLHLYSMQGPAALLSRSLPQEQVPYEKSFWGALEDPVRYLVTFIAFSQIGVMIAPTTIASQYIAQAWRGAVILSFIWFLHRWKTNIFARALATQNVAVLDQEKLLTLDRFSSVGLFILGLMALSEACGVAVQSILTVGGIGGVATAFAARDILGNVLSGLSMQFSKPFKLGDTIKAGSIEGQVVEMGLTTTSLLNVEKFPVIVPNSLFSSQVIVNKSRAQWRAMVAKIPLRIDDLEKIPQISEDIRSMLRSNSKVFLGKEAPYCFLSRIENSSAELTVGCNLIHMRKDEFYSTEQDILLQSVRIIKQHGAALGSTLLELNNQ